MKRVKNMIRSVWIRAQCVMHDNRGISVIELILVLVVIIGLVLIFKSQLPSLVETMFEKITSESAGI